MLENTVQSTDELLAELAETTDRIGLLESLLRDHARASGETITAEAAEFFADQIGRAYMELCEALNDLKLAMDVETHRNI